MGNVKFSGVSRRKFLHQTGAAVGSVILGAASSASASTAAEGLPRRVLGKTKIPVSILTLGTAPCGQSNFGTSRQVAERIKSLQLGNEVFVLYGGWRALAAAKLTKDFK